MQNKGIAIFGGSFNPPLNSHLELAKQVIKNLCNIEKVIFVPVSTKYNRKNNLTEDAHRYKMLKLMCNGEEKLEVSDVELSYGRQLYTIETLDIFKNEYPEYDIYFIMGTDNLKDLHTWKEPERILKNYKIIVLERNEDNLEKIIEEDKLLRDNKKALIIAKKIKPIKLSSTIIREKIKNGEEVESFFKKEVLEYINKNGLYKL
ncbi:MAG: nicotinate (nicotinamide) nucleotide adenylyltransferase [Clostridia bacterium]|nr:nicotinate (nicotinamide) nucleotide adenylyltransferase [Clostridia bacterium]